MALFHGASNDVVADPVTRIVASSQSVNLKLVDVVWRALPAAFARGNLVVTPRIGMQRVSPSAREEEEVDDSEENEEESEPHDRGREVLGGVIGGVRAEYVAAKFRS